MNAVVLTVSDRVSAGIGVDESGPAAAAILEQQGFSASVELVPDGVEPVEGFLRSAVESGIPLVVTTGGTGFAPRDLTPEATRRVIERPAPGLVEAMRSSTFGMNPHGMLSRAEAGIAGKTLIISSLLTKFGACGPNMVVIRPSALSCHCSISWMFSRKLLSPVDLSHGRGCVGSSSRLPALSSRTMPLSAARIPDFSNMGAVILVPWP